MKKRYKKHVGYVKPEPEMPEAGAQPTGRVLPLGTAVAVIDMDIRGLQAKIDRAGDALNELEKAGGSAFAAAVRRKMRDD